MTVGGAAVVITISGCKLMINCNKTFFYHLLFIGSVGGFSEISERKELLGDFTIFCL